ncbi:MAG: hypothetical protein KKG75_04935 [Nanoarchaeota archaeon]|nr:hypothetical protein [Nanoarchaeota archaeon]
MSLLGKITGIGTLAALTALVSPRATEADVRISPRIGYQIPLSEQVTEDYTAGFAFGLDFKLANPNVSLDLGISTYQSDGDNYSSSERGFFIDESSSYSESLGEISLTEGLTFNLGNNLFLGGGLRQTLFSENESYNSSGRESYSSSDRDVKDTTFGYYGKLGIGMPVVLEDKTHFGYFQVEFRNDFEDNYPGIAIFLGCDISLD